MRLLRLPLALLVCTAVCPAQVPSALYDQLQWRMIGPFRGGRIAAVSGVIGDATTFYFGSVGGGVWKTTNAGTTWVPIFDSQPIASIGAIAVSPSNPNVIYVGTGEADIRSQIGFGDGVYKSTDAGKTWQNIGLRDTRQIACIRVDSPQSRSRVRGGARARVRAASRSRGLPVQRRRADVAEGAGSRTGDRSRGPGLRSHQLANHLRDGVDCAPHGLEPVRADRRTG